METTGFSAEQSTNLGELRDESLRTVALVLTGVSCVLLWLNIWPPTGLGGQVGAWIGAGALALGATAAQRLARTGRRSAPALLIAGAFIAVASLLLSTRVASLAYLFVIVVVIASVLIERTVTLLVALLAGVAAALLGVAWLGLPLFSLDLGLPIAVIAAVALASSLSVRNLYTALFWAWEGYASARRSEQMARERRAELLRALKALDEATYRLEHANHMLALARDQADEARRLKQQFAQTISHELRTPLNLIVGFADLMAKSPEYYGSALPPAYLRDLSIVSRNATMLQALVNDVLDLARIEAAQMTLVLEETDPGSLVEDTAQTARSLIEARGLRLLIDVEPDLPPIPADPTRVRQVLLNLLNNAARFTEKGSVTVSVRRQGEEILFRVADTGVGIAPEDMARIFHEFGQLNSEDQRRRAGAGLGLVICREFVELHGGHIEVQSQLGVGSVFSFTLPVGRRPTPAPLAYASASGPAQQSSEQILLAVTQSAAAVAFLTHYLRGCRVVAVPDIEKARGAAQQILPHMVIVDAACPSVQGQALEGLAQAWELPSTPFLVCPLPGDKSPCERLGVDGYLIKPVTRSSVRETVRRFGSQVDRLLIVDDDHDFVRLLSRMLEGPVPPFQLTGAYSGQEAITKMRRQAPDLILLDLMLPDMSGFELVERIRAVPSWSAIPIVIVSGHLDAELMEATAGTVSISKAHGLAPGEVVELVRFMLHPLAH
mgnify:CR=1 FL=1